MWVLSVLLPLLSPQKYSGYWVFVFFGEVWVRTHGCEKSFGWGIRFLIGMTRIHGLNKIVPEKGVEVL